MKQALFTLMIIAFIGCREQADNNALLQKRIDSLEVKINDTYKPGFGEFMSNIQVHHEKLWFAGINQNWELADFEINELKESLDGIRKFCTDRPETKSIGMIDQPLQDVSNAIQQKSDSTFRNSFIILTATCNSCHRETQHGFNEIIIPSTPPFSNQVFRLPDKK